MMKINNKSVVRFLFRLHIVLLVATVLGFAVVGLFFPVLFRKLKYIGFAFVIYNIVKILRLNYIEYENSGEVITLRSYNIFRKKYQGRQIEMPLEHIREIYVQKTFWINYLIIDIQKHNTKEVRIHFPIDHMKRKDLMLIEKTFTTGTL
ncbi:MAG: hypothetical protein EOO19_12715 [Chryseobacterium sp.]|nr:MAG: hypothetical protein EOO19_12715 [Chryseobacterium sp.]